MDKNVISYAFNIDTARVEIKYADGSMIAIDCTLVEAEVAQNMYESIELKWLVYNAPVDYVNLLLHGDVREYLRNVTEYRGFSIEYQYKNGKCRRLSSHRLDVRLHFSFLYYITLGEGVNSLGRGCNVEE